MFIEEIIGAFTGQNRRTRRTQVAIGTGIGLLVGAVAALLLAPKSGKETRQDIVRLSLKGKDLVVDCANQGYGKAKELLQAASNQLLGLGEEAGQYLGEAGENAGRLSQKAARQARRLVRQARRGAYKGVSALAEYLKEEEEVEAAIDNLEAKLEELNEQVEGETAEVSEEESK